MRRADVQRALACGVRGITGRLDERTRTLCALAGYVASGNLAELARVWTALPVADHAAGTEVVLQNITTNGIPRTLMGLTTITEVGVKDRIILNQWPSTPDHHKEFTRLGLETIDKVYGYKAQRYLKMARALHPAYGRWCRDFVYGRVRSRPGLDLKTRCLCELAAIGGQLYFPQVRNGIHCALTAGATLEEVRGVLDMTGAVWGPANQAVVDNLWRELNPKHTDHWRLPDDPAAAQELLTSNSTISSTETLKEDYAHLRKEGDIPVASWRNPALNQIRNVPGLNDRDRLFALTAAHASSGNLAALRHDWCFMRPVMQASGLEALLEIAVFSGFHRLSNALRTVHEQGVVDTAIDPDLEDKVDAVTFPAAGTEVMKQIYTKTLPALQKSLSGMHPDIWGWINEWAYGQVLARPGLSVRQREFVAVLCMVGSGTFPQLRSHMRGALFCGATPDDVRGILDQAGAVWGRPAQHAIDGYWLAFIKEIEETAAKKGHPVLRAEDKAL